MKILLTKLFLILLSLNIISQNKEKSIENNSTNIIADILSNMVLVEGGLFQMGDFTRKGRGNEFPIHPVILDDYHISKYEVTFEQYDKFCEETGRVKPNDKGWGRGKNPVINVTWDDAVAFCKWVSEKTNKYFRLPTEAEWEYAARERGKNIVYSGTSDLKMLDKYAWYNENSGHKMNPVGQKLPNALGLFDMSGNAMEWCSDWYDDNYYKVSPVYNPKGPKTGTNHVLRGGSGYYYENLCRTTNRDGKVIPVYWYGLIGFRLVAEN